jgi:hypothetical protein
MPRKSTEQRLVSILLASVYLLLTISFVWFLFVYFLEWRPSAAHRVPRWLDVLLPIAICIGIVRFLRRAREMWRLYRSL